jgi:hypothetical protein
VIGFPFEPHRLWQPRGWAGKREAVNLASFTVGQIW